MKLIRSYIKISRNWLVIFFSLHILNVSVDIDGLISVHDRIEIERKSLNKFESLAEMVYFLIFDDHLPDNPFSVNENKGIKYIPSFSFDLDIPEMPAREFFEKPFSLFISRLYNSPVSDLISPPPQY
ncbi:hypothetical protein [Aureibacter tunicatorum]|uniref:Uncharacterized protein n=1 Tax=Aureibacter tunicatorum TaxID=866807 RepID=A0AAE3XJG1_9BACT|nr:hypothetical protein [Aureibacter tunicatorum]MDR6237502.1 hypothetical protein [Aureibacter tunicatorum]BDD02536.1 hypothetical protein AUTU_00190 [Aureibacter tunicatorum]